MTMGRHVFRYNYYRVKDCSAARHKTGTEAHAVYSGQASLMMPERFSRSETRGKKRISDRAIWFLRAFLQPLPRESRTAGQEGGLSAGV